MRKVSFSQISTDVEGVQICLFSSFKTLYSVMLSSVLKKIDFCWIFASISALHMIFVVYLYILQPKGTLAIPCLALSLSLPRFDIYLDLSLLREKES